MFDPHASRSVVGARSGAPGRCAAGVTRFAVLAVLAVAVVLTACRKSVAPLADVGARTDAITVSGLSAGAYMAGQFQMAEARRVTGVGLIAGGEAFPSSSRMSVDSSVTVMLSSF